LRRPPRRDLLLLGLILLVIVGFWGIAYWLKHAEPEATMDGRTVSQWVEQLRDPDAANRIRAAGALGAMGPRAEKSAEALRQIILEDVDPFVRQAAYQALLAVDPESARTIPFRRVPLGGL
jgi:HEAT repeat protein